MRKPRKTIDTTPKTLDLRDRLKVLIDKELDGLPALLDTLNDKERLEVVLKLMPIVLPKAKPVHHTANEPSDWGSFD